MQLLCQQLHHSHDQLSIFSLEFHMLQDCTIPQSDEYHPNYLIQVSWVFAQAVEETMNIINQFQRKAMSSEDVAAYLNEVASNQRKLQYCKQILTGNPNFIPEYIFNLKSAPATHTQSKSQFIQSMRALGLGCTPQEEELIYSYFQIDAKNYIPYDQFLNLILPHTDPSLKKIIAKRNTEEFLLDYSLRFSLQKYFFQIIENQVKLQRMCKFTFPKGSQQKKIRSKKVDVDGLVYFMNVHGKFPSQKDCQSIARELNLVKGQNKRNKYIVEFILEFNDKHKSKVQPLPTVIYKEPINLGQVSERYVKKTENKQNKNNFQNKKQKIDFSQNKQKVNPLFSNNPLQELSKSLIIKDTVPRNTSSPMKAINEVENRIKTLMSQVNVKYKQIQSNKKYQQSQQPNKIQMRGSLVQQIKDQLKKQKQTKSQLKSDANIRNLDFKKEIYGKYNYDKQPSEMTDRNVSKRNSQLEYDAVTERNKSDRFAYLRQQKRIEQHFQNESNSSSQVVFKPKTKVSNLLNSSEKLKLFDRSGKDQNNRHSQRRKIDGPSEGLKRIQYLKSLIQEKNSARKQY